MRSDPFGVCVSPRNFAEQMAVLRAHAAPRRLDALESALTLDVAASSAAPGGGRRPVIVTFDDGYLDNLTRALPALERCAVPATVFVASGYVGSGRRYWWDELAAILLRPGRLPESLTVEVGGATITWSLGRDAAYGPARAFAHRHWRIWHEPPPTRRHELFLRLWRAMHDGTTAARERALTVMRAWTRTPPPDPGEHRCVNVDELRLLARSPLIEIGAHTVSHPALSAISVDEQRGEILQSKVRLEELLGRPVTSFAYPFGTRSDYSARTVELVREAGYARCCSNFAGAITSDVDRYQLPRRVVLNWRGREFCERLSKWFADG